MTTIAETRHEPSPASSVTRWTRIVYLLCAALFAGCLVVQFFWAGAGVLVFPGYWGMHKAFGQAIQWFTVAMLLSGIVGRLPRRMQGLNVLLVLLFGLQYVLVFAVPNGSMSVLRALHAVNGLALFWLATYLTRRAWRLVRAVPV